MKHRTYTAVAKRKGDEWRLRVAELPGVETRVRKLGNAEPELITTIADYLGVSPSLVSVTVPHPVRPARSRLRDRVSSTAVQLWGGLTVLSGVYLALGLAVTLITAGIGVTALATLRESGRI